MTFKRKKRPLTLLELMIGLLLIAVVSGVIGIRIGKAIEEKRFRSSVERLFVELESCRRLALSAEVDWIVLLETKNGSLLLRKTCPETGKEIRASWKSPCKIFFNGEDARALSFQFTSSGKVSPAGVLILADGKRRVTWYLPDQFTVFEEK